MAVRRRRASPPPPLSPAPQARPPGGPAVARGALITPKLTGNFPDYERVLPKHPQEVQPDYSVEKTALALGMSAPAVKTAHHRPARP